MYSQNRNRTVVIGGGLAGLSAAWKAAQAGQSVVMLERSPFLGGRCASFYDLPSERWLDNCPHAFLDCCDGVREFFAQTGLIEYWKPEREFYFYPPGKPATAAPRPFKESDRLPGILRLAPALRSLNYLSRKERLKIVFDMLAIARQKTFDGSFGQWLDKRKTPSSVRTLFYEPIVLSALSCSLDRPSYNMVRKVFVCSFFEGRNRWNCSLPTVPLQELFDVKLAEKLQERGVEIRRSCTVAELERGKTRVRVVKLSTGERVLGEKYVLATNFSTAQTLFSPLASLADSYQTESVSCVHFWTDSPFLPTPHGIFPRRTIQWIFSGEKDEVGYYHRGVVSGTNSWLERKNGFKSQVRQELAEINPTAKILRLETTHWKDAVCVPTAEWMAARQRWFEQTPLPENLVLAGDWTNLDWPSTMEAAVLIRN